MNTDELKARVEKLQAENAVLKERADLIKRIAQLKSENDDLRERADDTDSE